MKSNRSSEEQRNEVHSKNQMPAKWLGGIATKTDNLSLISTTHMMEEENCVMKVVL